jgi:hypothetical protein
MNAHTGSAPRAQDITLSNSLTDLAARIRQEHEAVSVALKDSVRHAIEAGALLIEAKKQVPHGGWLPWLADHCTISERTAQLYMRCAKNREAIEGQIRNGVADLSLNEAAAMLMLSSDVRKLLDFAKTAENLHGEELINFCVSEGVAVIYDPSYNPFAGRSDRERLDWLIFTMFLSCDTTVHRDGFAPQNAWQHVEYLLQRPFQNVEEWLGPEGDKWRRVYNYKNCSSMEKFKGAWEAFREQNRDLTLDDINAKLEALERQFEKDRAAGIITETNERRKRRRVSRNEQAGVAS